MYNMRNYSYLKFEILEFNNNIDNNFSNIIFKKKFHLFKL